MGALARSPTIAGLASQIDGARDGESWKPLVPLKVGGDMIPLFCVHGGSGNVASFPKLARALPDDQPVYALQWDGLSGKGGSRTIESMAASYIREVRTIQPRGPYLLTGQCIGGLIAREMARQLLEAREEVKLVVMYDSPNLSSRHFRIEKLPPLPRAAGHVLQRTFGFAAMWLRSRPVPRFQRLSLLVGDLLRRPPPGDQREARGAMVMVQAVWRYRVRPLAVHTVYFYTGLTLGWPMALAGRWTDGLLGWSDHLQSGFDAVRVAAEHNGIPFAPVAIARLDHELRLIQRPLQATPPVSCLSNDPEQRS